MKTFLKIRLFMILAACALLLGIAGSTEEVESKIVINEICAHNQTIMSQPNVGTCDYIEIYNAGEENVNLSGYSIQKNHSEENTFTFEDYELAAHSYVVVFAAGVIPDVDAHIFAPYRLSDNDVLYLSDPSGKIIDHVELPVTDPDVVYAREKDGAENWVTMLGSPWNDNDLSRQVLVADRSVEPPVFSVKSGIYQESFVLEIRGGV